MTRPWTEERLRALSHKELNTLYENARAHGSSEADDIIELIYQHKLLERLGGGLPRYHRTIQAIETICRSPAGNEAAVAAAEGGEAPMAGVDPLLKASVADYGHRDTTSWAGTFVAEEIEAEGWTRSGRKALPAGSVAKTAAFFVKPLSLSEMN